MGKSGYKVSETHLPLVNVPSCKNLNKTQSYRSHMLMKTTDRGKDGREGSRSRAQISEERERTRMGYSDSFCSRLREVACESSLRGDSVKKGKEWLETGHVNHYPRNAA